MSKATNENRYYVPLSIGAIKDGEMKFVNLGKNGDLRFISRNPENCTTLFETKFGKVKFTATLDSDSLDDLGNLHEVINKQADRWFKGEKYEVLKPSFNGTIKIGFKVGKVKKLNGDPYTEDELDLLLESGTVKRLEFSGNLWVRHEKLQYAVGYFYSLVACE